jgi:hypothetical protein
MTIIRRATTLVAGTIAFAIAAAPLLTTPLVSIGLMGTQPNFNAPSGTYDSDSVRASQYVKERQQALTNATKDAGGVMKQVCSSAGRNGTSSECGATSHWASGDRGGGGCDR